jgi:hypothetical protein
MSGVREYLCPRKQRRVLGFDDFDFGFDEFFRDVCSFLFKTTDERERLFECDFAIGVRHFPSMGGVYAM